jgi:hypothetical protein
MKGGMIIITSQQWEITWTKAHPHDASYVYLRVDIASMERGTLIKHSELGNNNMWGECTNIDGDHVILDVYPMMKGENKKVDKPIAITTKLAKEIILQKT